MSKIETNSLGICSFDSFNYRIPLDDIKILDDRILNKQVEARYIQDTGEIISTREIQANSLHPQRDGYKIHFQIQKLPDRDYIAILINSKLLEYQYLNGISMHTIELVYNNLMRCKVFECSFEDFLSKGKISDIDIKKDIEITKENFIKGIKELESASKPCKKINEGVKLFVNRNNIGVQWNDRRTAKPSKPFVKLYYKSIEAEYSDSEQVRNEEIPFFDTYVNAHELKDRVRVEVTLKNSKAVKMHGIDDMYLLTFLKLNQQQLNEILVKTFNQNVESRKPTIRKTTDEISPLNMLMFIHLNNMIENQKYTFEVALEYTIEHYTNKQQKHRQKLKLTEVYEKYIKGQEYELKTITLDKFFNQIGWN